MLNKKTSFLLLATTIWALVIWLTPPLQGASPSSSQSLNPTDDAHTLNVEASSPHDDGVLIVSMSCGAEECNATRYAYLKFNLTTVNSQIETAQLRLATLTCGGTVGPDPAAVAVYGAENDYSDNPGTPWVETGLTWDNQPNLDPAASAPLATLDAGTITADVAAYYDWTDDGTGNLAAWLESQRTGDGVATLRLAITSNATMDVYFEDREETGQDFGCTESLGPPILALTTAAQNATWTGPTNGDWNTGSNWSTGNVPDNNTNVTLPSGSSVQLSANASAASLTIENNATLDLKTYDLTVEDTVTNNGVLAQTKDVPSGTITQILHIQNAAQTETRYYGVQISASQALNSTSVRILGNQDCTTPAEAIVRRCFNITPTTPNSATIRYWLLPSELNSQSLTSLQVWDWNGTTWSGVGDSPMYGDDATCSGGAATCWYQYSNIANFSPHIADDSQPMNPPVAPLAVALANFSATAINDHIQVTWQTTLELNNLGFNIWRGSSEDGPETQLNPELIPSQAPGSGQGSSYEWQDTSVEAGVTYYYWLEGVDVSSTTSLHGPISATASVPTAVSLQEFHSHESNLPSILALVAMLGMIALATRLALSHHQRR